MHPLLKQLVAGFTCVTSIFCILYFVFCILYFCQCACAGADVACATAGSVSRLTPALCGRQDAIGAGARIHRDALLTAARAVMAAPDGGWNLTCVPACVCACVGASKVVGGGSHLCACVAVSVTSCVVVSAYVRCCMCGARGEIRRLLVVRAH